MLSFIKEVDDSTKFQIEVFDGKVVLQCRILSPIEAEAAGMSTSLVASSMMDTAQISRIMRQKDKLKNIDFNDPNDGDHLKTIDCGLECLPKKIVMQY
jgi:hypothetical protein